MASITERASYEKITVEDGEFPVVVLENDRSHPGTQLLCPLHWHEQLELHYIAEGSLEIWVNQTRLVLGAGDLLVINPNEAHSSYCTGRLKERILIFRLADLSPSLADRVTGFQALISGDPRINTLMAAFEAEYLGCEPGNETACKALLLQLLVHLTRNYPCSVPTDPKYRRQTQLLRRFEPVREYIMLHYADAIDPDTLAGLVYLSRDRFNHLFKECMGIPLRRYINEIRLHTAMDWLEKGLYTPAEAACQSGFTDYNHFGRLFRQAFGCSPSQVCSHKTAESYEFAAEKP